MTDLLNFKWAPSWVKLFNKTSQRPPSPASISPIAQNRELDSCQEGEGKSEEDSPSQGRRQLVGEVKGSNGEISSIFDNESLRAKGMRQHASGGGAQTAEEMRADAAEDAAKLDQLFEISGGGKVNKEGTGGETGAEAEAGTRTGTGTGRLDATSLPNLKGSLDLEDGDQAKRGRGQGQGRGQGRGRGQTQENRGIKLSPPAVARALGEAGGRSSNGGGGGSPAKLAPVAPANRSSGGGLIGTQDSVMMTKSGAMKMDHEPDGGALAIRTQDSVMMTKSGAMKMDHEPDGGALAIRTQNSVVMTKSGEANARRKARRMREQAETQRWEMGQNLEQSGGSGVSPKRDGAQRQRKKKERPGGKLAGEERKEETDGRAPSSSSSPAKPNSSLPSL